MFISIRSYYENSTEAYNKYIDIITLRIFAENGMIVLEESGSKWLNKLWDSIGIGAGVILAAIIVAFIRNRTENNENIGWVFEKIKMSGLKFDIMCKLVAIGLLLLFYPLHLMGISKIFPYVYKAFIYAEIRLC